MIRGILHNRNSVRKFPRQRKKRFLTNKDSKKGQTHGQHIKKIQKITAQKKQGSRADSTAREINSKKRLIVVIRFSFVILKVTKEKRITTMSVNCAWAVGSTTRPWRFFVIAATAAKTINNKNKKEKEKQDEKERLTIPFGDGISAITYHN